MSFYNLVDSLLSIRVDFIDKCFLHSTGNEMHRIPAIMYSLQLLGVAFCSSFRCGWWLSIESKWPCQEGTRRWGNRAKHFAKSVRRVSSLDRWAAPYFFLLLLLCLAPDRFVFVCEQHDPSLSQPSGRCPSTFDDRNAFSFLLKSLETSETIGNIF